MKWATRAVAALAIVPMIGIGAVMAQSSSTNSSPNPPAVSTGNAPSKTSAAPVAGANSFTEGEARKRIELYGYTNVTDLKMDSQSIWRGRATKDGKAVAVALDYQGNIVTQ